MILSDSEIARRLALPEGHDGRIIITPKPEIIQPASVDLHLSPDMQSLGCMGRNANCYAMEPGEFLLGSTVEHVEVPTDLTARVEGKSSLGRIGLMVHVTAGFVDPGFRGNITLELKNLSSRSIRLEAGMLISQLCFQKVVGVVLRPYGSDGLNSKYQDSKGTVVSRLSIDTKE